MEGELSELEVRVEQVLALCHRLIAENGALRAQVAGLENERSRLTAKIGAAAEQIEELMERLPQ